MRTHTQTETAADTQASLVLISTLVVDTRLQWRARGVDRATVKLYTSHIKDDPAYDLGTILVYELPAEDGTDKTAFFVVDGFHRVMAYTAAGRTHIPANVEFGRTWDEAYGAAARRNIEHDRAGLRLDRKSKQRILAYMLRPDGGEWCHLTLKQMCNELGVSSQSTITNWMQELERSGADIYLTETVVGIDGKEQPRYANPHPNGFKPNNPQTRKAQRRGKPLPDLTPPPIAGRVTITGTLSPDQPITMKHPAYGKIKIEQPSDLTHGTKLIPDATQDLASTDVIRLEHGDFSWQRISRMGTEALENMLFLIQRMNQAEVDLDNKHAVRSLEDVSIVEGVAAQVRHYLEGVLRLGK